MIMDIHVCSSKLDGEDEVVTTNVVTPGPKFVKISS
jgi:hypothetical protein